MPKIELKKNFQIQVCFSTMAKRLFNRGFNIPKKGNKYKNEKVEFDGIKFDSKRERDRYMVLKDAERRGVISELKCQPKFTLIPAQYHEEAKQLKTKVKMVKKCDFLAITYTGDFQYVKDGKVVVEDVKGMVTPEYKLKEKMMAYFHHIIIRRIKKPNEAI